jgi:hypothetical protein
MLTMPIVMPQNRVQHWLRKVLAPDPRERRREMVPPPGATKPVYVTLTWRTEHGSHTIKRIHFDHVEQELLNLLRRGIDATAWTEGENPREVGWVWMNGDKGVQCVEKWD